MEVVIPLKSGANLSGHSQQDILNAVQDEYFNRYLDQLGIAPTSANKAQMLKFRPMDDCEVQSMWADDTSSGLASALRIAPPLRHRVGYEDDDEQPLDRAIIAHLYGEADDIPVEPPNVPERTIFPVDLTKMFAEEKRQTQKADVTLAEVRKHKAEYEERIRRRAMAATGGTHAAGSLDSDQQQRFKQELESLKGKYILPFACDRPLQEGSRRTQIAPWPPQGPLDMKLQGDGAELVCEPLSIEIEQIQVQMKSWVQNQLPLELLSSSGRKDPQFLEELRGSLWETEVCQLIGVLAHLLYWLAFSCCRRPEQPRLSQFALQGLVTTAHESWVKLERRHKSSKLGNSLAMPCVLLTLKYGMEVCFESQYPSLFGEKSGEWATRQDLIERINTLLMRLFDPDGTYARFGRRGRGVKGGGTEGD
ncbi:MCAT [Symbiodinium natans]|uniref:MCAT protein n=1 Tax=Symbiodinium natans TaxID=878477 RepID=A0A812MA35_9DINO|nr:MCAT [Symbiodinium natans]